MLKLIKEELKCRLVVAFSVHMLRGTPAPWRTWEALTLIKELDARSRRTHMLCGNVDQLTLYKLYGSMLESSISVTVWGRTSSSKYPSSPAHTVMTRTWRDLITESSQNS